MEVALDLEVSHAEPQHRQLVQATSDLLGEGQHAGEAVQLHIEAVPVAFGRVGLHGRRLGAETTHETIREDTFSDACLLKHVRSA